MRPSGKFQFNKTPKHDMLHLWASKNAIYKAGDIFEFEVHENAHVDIEIEKPIFHKSYLIGIVDGVIDVNDTSHCFDDCMDCCEHEKVMTSNSGKKLYYLQNAIYRRVIYDIKPHLLINSSVSSAIGQLKTYAEWLKYYEYDGGEKSSELVRPRMLIITLDQSRKFDAMLKSQGIGVVHTSSV
jgi:hypothetical protein